MFTLLLKTLTFLIMLWPILQTYNNQNSLKIYNPKSEKVGTVWKTQIKKKVVISKFTLTCISLQTI